MAPKISFQMTPATKKMLQAMHNLLTVGELGFSSGLAADLIAEEARRLAPEGKTGNLKRGIVSRINKVAEHFMGVGAAYVGVDYHIAPHAHLVEFGHFIGFSNNWVPANPFMRPAIDAKQAEAAKIIDADLQQRIDKRMGGR